MHLLATAFHWLVLVPCIVVLRIASFVLPLQPLRALACYLIGQSVRWNPFITIKVLRRDTPFDRSKHRSLMVMSTHHSDLDPFVFMTVFNVEMAGIINNRRMRALYKKDLEEIPLLGPVVRALNWVAVDFKSKTVEDTSVKPESSMQLKRDVAAALGGAPTDFVVFPEGSRRPEGVIGEFKPFMFQQSQEHSVPILPCTLIGTGRIKPVNSFFGIWPGEIQLIVHPVIYPVAGEEPRAYAERVKSIMKSGY